MANRNPAIAEDLYKKQEALIQELREKNTNLIQRVDAVEQDNSDLRQKVEYYKGFQELFDLKQKFAREPQLYHQIIQPPNPMEDYRMMQQNKRARI